MHVIIIGAGAAGLAAACEAAGNGARVTVLERHQRPGRKILASGNGRCNIMNTGRCYYHGRDLAHAVLDTVSQDDLRAFFQRSGLNILREPEEDGRLYPGVMQSSAVLQCLLSRLRELKGRLMTDCPCEKIIPEADGFRVMTPQGDLWADRVIVAAGSPAGGSLGHDAYDLLGGLGHHVSELLPALCPINCTGLPFSKLKGLRFPAGLTLFRDRKAVEYARGELLLTDTGISGICAMQLSASAASYPFDGKTFIDADLSPLMDIVPRHHLHLTQKPFPIPDPQAAGALLKSRIAFLPRKRLLEGLIPAQMIPFLDDGKTDIPALAARLTNIRLTVTGVVEERSQVIRGGADTDGFDRDTLESKHHRHLYAAGEILDVDGDCGGFNLMFAFASGILAGRSAANDCGWRSK